MDAQKLQVKLYVAGDRPVDLERFIPVLHGWIKNKTLVEQLIDVANYAHVPKGPGVALIGHGSDYYIDGTDGRPGLLYSRKREAPAPDARLADAFRRAINGALLLEKDAAFAGKLQFRSDEILFRINDRLGAPAGEATFAALRPELDAFCANLFGGGGHQLALAGKPGDLFSVRISHTGKADLPAMLARLGGASGL